MIRRFFFAIVLLGTSVLIAEDFKPNYDESKVPQYTLQDPLKCEDGTEVTTPEQWKTKRRPELIHLFETHVYGKAPGRPDSQTAELMEEDQQALGGIATRRQVRIHLENNGKKHSMDLLIYVPNNKVHYNAVFLGLNFGGNHTVNPDPAILLPTSWVRGIPGSDAKDNKASEKDRGWQESRWQIEKVIKAGYGTATMYYGDIDPDFDDGFQNGVHALFRNGDDWPADNWGSIAAWAWGLSRIQDYFETDPALAQSKVILHGHSRLGKTALWAGALDERFDIVISNNSGCGGAALSVRAYGETVGRINRVFPHWFCDNYSKYNENEAVCPVDQHELIALIAPRPVYIASAEEDKWADPKGEFLAGVGADPVYRLLLRSVYGEEPIEFKLGIPAGSQPPIDQPLLGGFIGYHIRSGNHDVTEYDWTQFIEFTRKRFFPFL
jgi:hypothetical protein